MSDFKVQRGRATITGTNTTVVITAGTDYEAPAALSSAFIRIVGVGYAGDQVITNWWDGVRSSAIQLTNPGNLLTSITFQRNTQDGQDVSVEWEIVEYIGASEGANEFIVRGQGLLAATGGSASVDSGTISGVSDDADVAVLVLSQGSYTQSFSTTMFTGEWVAASSVERTLLRKFGRQIVIRYVTIGTYDTTTRTFSRSTSDQTVRALMEVPGLHDRQARGESGPAGAKSQEWKLTIAASELAREPTPSDLAVIDGKELEIMGVDPIYSGGLAALYQLRVKR